MRRAHVCIIIMKYIRMYLYGIIKRMTTTLCICLLYYCIYTYNIYKYTKYNHHKNIVIFNIDIDI